MGTVNKDFKVKNGLIVGGTGSFVGTVTVATPTANNHAATKEYVDQNAGGGGSSLTVSDTPPQSPSIGDLWYNSLDGSTYVYYDSFWVESSSAYAGPQGESGIITATSPLAVDPETNVLSIDLSGYATTEQLDDKKTQIAQEVSSNITMASNYRYFVDTSAARTLTLPATPALGDEIQIFDATGSGATNNVTVQNNNQKINGTLTSVIIDIGAFVVSFIYTGSSYGWRMV